MGSALVSLTFDDGLRSQFEQAVPILDQFGFPATFLLIANTEPANIDPSLELSKTWRKTDWSENDIRGFKSMIHKGHEIGAHSVTHRYPLIDDQPKCEAEGSKEWIETRLGVEIPSYCYPFYRITEPIKNAVINAGYKQARGGPGIPIFRQAFRTGSRWHLTRFQPNGITAKARMSVNGYDLIAGTC